MPPRAQRRLSFVDRHDLWSDEQRRAASAVEREIKRRKLEVIRFAFCDQHGVLRGKTLVASEAIKAMRAGVTMTSTLLAKDTSHRTVFDVFSAGGGMGLDEMAGAGNFVMVADPSTFRVLGRQRDRWQRGLTDVLWRHRGLFFNPRYGRMGMIVYPYFVLNELLAPVVEAVGFLGVVLGLLLNALNWPFAILFFLTAYGLGAVLTLTALVLEEMNFHRYHTFGDRVMLVVWALLENLGYRQLTVFWRLKGMFNYIRGSRAWGKMDRAGFHTGTAQVADEKAQQPGAIPAPVAPPR